MKTAYLFPGQGAQEVGMGRDVFEAVPESAELFRRADEILGYSLSDLCFNGPEEQLNSTECSQPAIFVTSAALLKAIHMGRIAEELATFKPQCCLGLSLGEYTALYAAGAMGFEDALRLVALRGRSMQAAAEANPGGMVSILGLDAEQIDQLCAAVRDACREKGVETPILKPVNYNCPGQIVVSGSIPACETAEHMAESFGASRAIRLKVSGAFHTEMVSSAADALAEAIKKTSIQRPDSSVVANVDASLYDAADEAPAKLLGQLVQPVLFQQSVDWLLEQGVERFIEIGPGRVLTGLVKKIARAKRLKPVFMTINGME